MPPKKKNDDWDIQAIVIPISSTQDDIDRITEEFLHKKKVFKRITKNSIRLRNIAKQKFQKGSFKTKIIDDEISLVMGKLKPEFKHLKGGGVFDFVKSGFNKAKEGISNFILGDTFRRDLENYSKGSQSTLEKYGNMPILSLYVCRRPIPKMVDIGLNAMSLGKFNQFKKDNGFNEFYHLFLIANVGVKNILIEKNEVINITDNFKEDAKEKLQVNLNGKKITLFDLINNGRKMAGNNVVWFGYNASQNNCQSFVKYILEANGLMTPEIKNFAYQEIGNMGKYVPSTVLNIAKKITDTAGVFSKLLGRGKDDKVKRLLALEMLENGVKVNPKHKRIIKFENYKFTPSEIYDEMENIKALANL